MISRARGVRRRNDFVIVIKVSNATRVGVKARVLIACERSRHCKHDRNNDKGPTKKKIKQTCLKKCGCPFALKGKRLDIDDDCMLEVVCGVRNHLAVEHLRGIHLKAYYMRRKQSC